MVLTSPSSTARRPCCERHFFLAPKRQGGRGNDDPLGLGDINPSHTGEDIIKMELGTEDHGDHQHHHCIRTETKGLLKEIHERLKKKEAEIQEANLKANEEGCPCCLVAPDLDELAVALKQLLGSMEESHGVVAVADFDSGSHWGIFSFTSFLGVIGLTAAIRNITGCWKNIKKIRATMGYVNTLIAEGERLKILNEGDPEKLKALVGTLRYSMFDAQANFTLPGIVNGLASICIMASGFISQPFALPLLGVYAGGQTLRSGFDLARVATRPDVTEGGNSPFWAVGRQKMTKINRQKIGFFLTNGLGFACFAVGALVTFASIPAIGFGGMGALGLPIGLGLLAFGSCFTGVTNNIFPRRFKPRNAGLGHNDRNWDTTECVEQVAWRRYLKKPLKDFKRGAGLQSGAKRFGYLMLAVLPGVRFLGTGRFATARLHKHEKDRAIEGHSQLEKSLEKSDIRNTALAKMVDKRNKALAEMSGQGEVSDQETAKINSLNISDAIKQSWKHLENLAEDTQAPKVSDSSAFAYMRQDFLNTYVNEGFAIECDTKTATQESCPDGCCRDHSSLGHLKGFSSTDTFDINDFLREANYEDMKRFSGALDFYLTSTFLGKLTYEEYGIMDFYYAIKKGGLKDSLAKLLKGNKQPENAS